MKSRRVFCIVILLMILAFSILSGGWTQTNPEIKPPVITHSYAIGKGKYGYIWKIYIEAEDPDGDMQKIAVSVDQIGYGHYPTEFIILKHRYRKHLKGYLQWNTYSSKAPYIREWTQITMKVSIFDKAGNESNEMVFPFTFETGVGREPKPKPSAPFDRGEAPKLGNIHIDLFEPTLMGNGHRDD